MPPIEIHNAFLPSLGPNPERNPVHADGLGVMVKLTMHTECLYSNSPSIFSLHRTKG